MQRKKTKDVTFDGKSGRWGRSQDSQDSVRRVLFVMIGLMAVIFAAYKVGTWNGPVVIVKVQDIAPDGTLPFALSSFASLIIRQISSKGCDYKQLKYALCSEKLKLLVIWWKSRSCRSSCGPYGAYSI